MTASRSLKWTAGLVLAPFLLAVLFIAIFDLFFDQIEACRAFGQATAAA